MHSAIYYLHVQNNLLCLIFAYFKVTDVTFHQPVNEQVFNDYRQFVVYPMHLDAIEQKIASNSYKSPASFLSDCKWIHHNSYVYNNASHPLTLNARYMLKVARNELLELETCADCFDHYYTDPVHFFRQVCSRPHTLVFAKLEGHPLWPSKVVKIDRKLGQAEVRFFGAHDRASVPFESCFLIPEKFPNWKIPRNQKTKFESAITEFKGHLELLKEKFPDLLEFAAPKTPFNPNRLFLNDPDIPYVPEPKEEEEDKKKRTPSTPSSVITPSNLASVTPSIPSETSTAARTPTGTPNPTPTRHRSYSKKEMSEFSISSESSKPNQSAYDFNDECDSPRLEINLSTKKQPKKRPKTALNSSTVADLESVSSATKLVKPNVNGTSDINKKSTPASRTKRTLPDESSGVPESAKKKKAKVKKVPESLDESVTSVSIGPDAEPLIVLNEEIRQLKQKVSDLTTQHLQELNDLKEEHLLELETIQKQAEESAKSQLEDLRNELTNKFEKTAIEIKRKQWCSFCTKEANYFCCWNSSYCSYQCQIKHWPEHLHGCQQNTYSDRQKDAKDGDKEPSDKETVKASELNENMEDSTKEVIEKESVKPIPPASKSRSRKGETDKRSQLPSTTETNVAVVANEPSSDLDKLNGTNDKTLIEPKSSTKTLGNKSKESSMSTRKNLSKVKQTPAAPTTIQEPKKPEISDIKIKAKESDLHTSSDSKSKTEREMFLHTKSIELAVKSLESDPKVVEAIANLPKPDEKFEHVGFSVSEPDSKLTEAIANLPKPDDQRTASQRIQEVNAALPEPDHESTEAIANLLESDPESSEAIANLLQVDHETEDAISELTRVNEELANENALQLISLDQTSTAMAHHSLSTPNSTEFIDDDEDDEDDFENEADSVTVNPINPVQPCQISTASHNEGTPLTRNGNGIQDDKDEKDNDVESEVRQLITERLDQLIDQQLTQT